MVEHIGVLTSNGDAPRMNAAIRAVTRVALNSGIEVFGVYDGYKGMVEGYVEPSTRASVGGIVDRGGTILGPVRLPEFRDIEVRNKAVQQLKECGIRAIVVVGDDGSYRGALVLMEIGISCIGLPGTINNNTACTDSTIGFDTALTTIIGAVDKLRDTSSSHHHCSIVGVMGNCCGDLATWPGIACDAEIVITSFTGFEEGEVLERLRGFDLIKKKRHTIVVISEEITDVRQFAKKISLDTGFSGRATVLGHVQRGGSPTPTDRVLTSHMGEKAMDLLTQGVGGQCTSIKGDQTISAPIEETLNMPKESCKRLQNLFNRLV